MRSWRTRSSGTSWCRIPDGMIAGCVEEILRWSSPVMYLRRNVTVVTELRGQTRRPATRSRSGTSRRSEEHTSELQSHLNLVCRLLLEKNKKKINVTSKSSKKKKKQKN